MGTKIYGYAKISNTVSEDNPEITMLKKLGIPDDNIFTDAADGEDHIRDEFESILHDKKKGDLLVIMAVTNLDCVYTDAIAKHMHRGRHPIQKPELWDTVYGQWIRGMITAKYAMEQLGLKRTTFYKFAKQNKIDKNKAINIIERSTF